MRYILGAGLNGLIFAHFNPEFEVIGKLEPMPKIMDHIVTLHDNKENRTLLESLGIEPRPRSLPIKYFFNGKYYSYMPEPIVTDYVLKKMNGREEMIDQDRTLSVSSDELHFLDTPITEVYQALADSIIVEEEMLTNIKDLTFKTMEEGERKYEILISTIPATHFWEYYKGRRPKNLDLLYGGATFKVCSDPPPGAERFAFAYFADDRPYHRVFGLRDKYVYEYAGRYDTDDATYLPVSYLRTDKHNVSPPRILFCGRHASWKHWWKVEDTVRLSRSRFTWEMMLNRQALFQTNFSDLNRDVGELTEDTVYYMTCVESELHSMLNELNWKKWKPGEKPARLKVLEEYVDALKFLLTIGAIWNFGPDEIFEMFETKSGVVETNYHGGEDD